MNYEWYIKRSINPFYRNQKVLTFHPGRCGSTVLGAMLNFHSKIFWGGEVFERKWKHNFDRSESSEILVKRKLIEAENNKISRCFGFEVKYLPQQHLSEKNIDMNLKFFIEFISDLGYDKYIILRRKNYLRSAISVLVGRKRQKWHSKTDATEPISVNINVNALKTGVGLLSLLDTFKMMDEKYENLSLILRDQKTLKLSYENDIKDDPKKAYKKVLKFIGYKYEKQSIPFKKTNPFNLNDMIINYKEVYDHLVDTKYEWMLYD